jgi:hypothetical protein
MVKNYSAIKTHMDRECVLANLARVIARVPEAHWDDQFVWIAKGDGKSLGAKTKRAHAQFCPAVGMALASGSVVCRDMQVDFRTFRSRDDFDKSSNSNVLELQAHKCCYGLWVEKLTPRMFLTSKVFRGLHEVIKFEDAGVKDIKATDLLYKQLGKGGKLSVAHKFGHTDMTCLSPERAKNLLAMILYKYACMGLGDVGFRAIVNRRPFHKHDPDIEGRTQKGNMHFLEVSPRGQVYLQKEDIFQLEPELWKKMCKVMACERLNLAILWSEGVEWLRTDREFVGLCEKKGMKADDIPPLDAQLTGVPLDYEMKQQQLARLPQLFHKDVVKGFFTTTPNREYMPVQAIMAVEKDTTLDFWHPYTAFYNNRTQQHVCHPTDQHLGFCGSLKDWEKYASRATCRSFTFPIFPGHARLFHGLAIHRGTGIVPNFRFFFARRGGPRERDLDEDLQAYMDQNTHEERIDFEYVYSWQHLDPSPRDLSEDLETWNELEIDKLINLIEQENKPSVFRATLIEYVTLGFNLWRQSKLDHPGRKVKRVERPEPQASK